ncbi:MAG TPA: hypothetical protein VFD35_11615 [Pricia sp.]|nr:hypothetical protein [Pricia sp.]
MVSVWLVAIALSLIFGLSYVDVAVRDLVMAIAAFCLAKLSEKSAVRVNG